MKIGMIEGIGPVNADKLGQYGIKSTLSLLNVAANSQGRKAVSVQTGIAESQLLAWVNQADLLRVKGVGEEYSDLLEAAGVDTVQELGARRPGNLHKTLHLVNSDKHLVRRVPSLTEVRRWVKKAKTLRPLITD